MNWVLWAIVWGVVGGGCRWLDLKYRSKGQSWGDVARDHPTDIGIATVFMAVVGALITRQ